VRPGRAADHSPTFSAAVMKEYSYTSTHPLGHTGPVTGSLYLIYIFIYRLKSVHGLFRTLSVYSFIRQPVCELL